MEILLTTVSLWIKKSVSIVKESSFIEVYVVIIQLGETRIGKNLFLNSWEVFCRAWQHESWMPSMYNSVFTYFAFCLWTLSALHILKQFLFLYSYRDQREETVFLWTEKFYSERVTHVRLYWFWVKLELELKFLFSLAGTRLYSQGKILGKMWC